MNELGEEESSEEEEVVIPEESKISKTLSDKTTKTVVLLVLCMLFMLAVCSLDTYVDPIYLHEQALKNLSHLFELKGNFYPQYKQAYEHFIKETRSLEYPLVFLTAPDPYADNFSDELIMKEWEPKLSSLRKDEYSSVSIVDEHGTEFIAAFSTQSYVLIESKINICRTSFIVVVLGLASIYFTKDAQELVLDPLERMIEKVKLIAKNPLAAATEEVHEAGIMSFASQKEEDNLID